METIYAMTLYSSRPDARNAHQWDPSDGMALPPDAYRDLLRRDGSARFAESVLLREIVAIAPGFYAVCLRLGLFSLTRYRIATKINSSILLTTQKDDPWMPLMTFMATL